MSALRQRCQELGGWLTVLRQPAGAALPTWLDAPSRPLIEAVKQQQKTIHEERQTNKEQQAELDSLKAEVEKLKALMQGR